MPNLAQPKDQLGAAASLCSVGEDGDVESSWGKDSCTDDTKVGADVTAKIWSTEDFRGATGVLLLDQHTWVHC